MQTRDYRAPEVIAQCPICLVKFLDRADVWASAVVLFEAASSQPPWPCDSEWQLAIAMVRTFGVDAFREFAKASASKVFLEVPATTVQTSLDPPIPFGNSGTVMWRGLFVPHPSRRPSAKAASEIFAYLQDRPVLTSKADALGNVVVRGARASCVIQESIMEPALLDLLRADFTDDVLKEASVCWEPEQTVRTCHENIGAQTVKCLLSGHDGAGSRGSSVNGLQLDRALPFPSVCRFMRAMRRINEEAYADLTGNVRDELRARVPQQWIKSCPPPPATIDGVFCFVQTGPEYIQPIRTLTHRIGSNAFQPKGAQNGIRSSASLEICAICCIHLSQSTTRHRCISNGSTPTI